MRTIAYYVWKIGITIRNLLGRCKYCKKRNDQNRCILIPITEEWNCVYFERRAD